MFLVRRCIIEKHGILQIPRSCGVSRRWISQSSILFNKNNNNTTNDSSEPDLSESQKESTEKSETPKDSKTSKTSRKEKKLSVIEFMNQSRLKIPSDWRKDTGMPEWKRQKFALAEKFKGKKWSPQKKLSREEMNSVRVLKKELPDMTTAEIATHFKISPEAVRRILRSKWEPTLEEEEDMFDRWKRRGEAIKKIYEEKNETRTKVILKTGDKYTKVKYQKHKQKKAPTASEIAEKERKKKKLRSKKPKLRDMMF